MVLVAILSLVLVLGLIVWLKNLRRELIVVSLFSLLPFIVTPILFAGSLTNFSAKNFLPVFPQLTVAIFLAASSYALYHLLLRRLTTPAVNLNRQKLIFLLWTAVVVGPLLAFGFPTTPSLAIGAAVTLIAAVLMRRHLVWETLFSGLGMGLLFIVTALIAQHVSPSLFDDVWQSQAGSSLHFLRVPFEQIAALMFLGLMSGPIFLALKDPPQVISEPFIKDHIQVKAVSGLVVLAIVLAGAGSLAYNYTFKNQVIVANYSGEKLAPLNSQIRLELSRPIDQTAVKLRIAPEIEGEWSFEDALLGSRWFRTLVFTPSAVFSPGETYQIEATDMRYLFRGESATYVHTFKVEPPPQVNRTAPAEGATDHEICDPITISFNATISDYWRPDFVLEPAAVMEVTKKAGDYTLKPKECLSQGLTYSLTVTSQATNSSAPLATLHFTTKSAPGIASYSPRGEAVVVSTSVIEINFTKAMKTDDPLPYLSISPALAGSWSWQADGTMLRYTLTQALSHATKYQITLKKGLPEAVGSGFLEETVISFTTIGPVRISSSAPANGSRMVHESVQPYIQFSQSVDHASAEERISVEPALPIGFSWSGNRLIIKANSHFGYGTTYTVRVKAGVKSAQGGLDLAQDFTSSFSVRPAPPVPITFGHSEKGRGISGYIFGNGPNVTLLFGAIHGGKEPSSARLMERLVEELGSNPGRVAGHKTIIVIPIANPDGYFERKDKQNSRGVNLNRNFDTSNWNEAGWDTEGSIGSEPFSESESRVIRSVVQRYGVGAMFAFHSQGNLINPELGHGPSQSAARSYANLSGYHYYEDGAWNFPGTATRWFREMVGGPAVTVELASHTVADWSRHQRALFALVQ